MKKKSLPNSPTPTAEQEAEILKCFLTDIENTVPTIAKKTNVNENRVHQTIDKYYYENRKRII